MRSPSPAPAEADRRTLAPRICQLLKAGILDGTFPPGSPLKQEALAARYGVSRIPLREALRQLESEGFVVIHPYQGAKVAPLSVEEVHEIRDLRLALESHALRLAIPRMTPQLLRRAAQINAIRARQTDPLRWAALGEEFFRILYGCAGRPRLLAYIISLHQLSLRYARRVVRNARTRRVTGANWSAVLRACARGESEEAAASLAMTYGGLDRWLTTRLRERGARAGKQPPGRGRASTGSAPCD